MDPFAWSVRSILYKLTATRNQYGLDLDAAAKSLLHIEDLSLDYDFIKCDIEEHEILMMPYAKALKPCVAEVHNWYLKEQFEKVGFSTKLLVDQMLGQGIMVNWAVGPTKEVAVNGKRL